MLKIKEMQRKIKVRNTTHRASFQPHIRLQRIKWEDIYCKHGPVRHEGLHTLTAFCYKIIYTYIPQCKVTFWIYSLYIKAIIKKLQKLKHLTHKSKELLFLKCIFWNFIIFYITYLHNIFVKFFYGRYSNTFVNYYKYIYNEMFIRSKQSSDCI